MEVDRSKCTPVLPGGECPNCGWTNERPFIKGQPEVAEPHPVLAHGLPAGIASGVCANCGAAWNLDVVKCSACGFEPKDEAMYADLEKKKNAVRKSQYLGPMPVKGAPIMNTADVAKAKADLDAKEKDAGKGKIVSPSDTH